MVEETAQSDTELTSTTPELFPTCPTHMAPGLRESLFVLSKASCAYQNSPCVRKLHCLSFLLPFPPPFSPSRKKKSNFILYVISHSSHSASLLLLLHWSRIQITDLKPGSAFDYLFHFKQIPTDPLILHQCAPASGKNSLTLIMERKLLWESQSLGSSCLNYKLTDCIDLRKSVNSFDPTLAPF